MDRPAMPTRVRAAAAAIASLVAFSAVDVRAGDWTFTPSVAVGETYTDNAGLATGSEVRESDLITSVAPGFRLLGQGGRATVSLNYTLSRNFYRKDTDRNSTDNDLLGTGQVELWDRRLFVDAQSSISRQKGTTGDATSSSAAGQDINRTSVRVINVSPFFRHHFGTWVETESRVRVSQVNTDGTEAQDTMSTRETFVASSGRRFTTLQWSLSLDSNKTRNEGDTPSDRERREDANFTYIVSPAFSLLAGVGHEFIEDSTLTDPPRGITWNLGFASRPSSRTSFRMTYGTRNQSNTLDMQASHRLSERTTVLATYSDTLQTSQRLVSNVLGFLAPDPANPGGLIDTRTNAPFVPSDSDFGLQDPTFRQQVFQLRATGSRRRNDFSGGLVWEKRNTEATGVIESIVGGDVALTRRMSRRSSGSISFGYRATDFGTADSRKDDEITAALSYRYDIFKDVEGSLTYNLTRRNSNVADEDFVENVISIRLNKRF